MIKVVILSAQLLNLYQKGGFGWDDMLGTNYWSALRLEKVLDLSLVDNHVYWKTNYTSLTPTIQIKC